MAEMLVTSPEVKKIVDEYDFLFTTGMMLPFTVDSDLGESIRFSENVIIVKLKPKPSLADPNKTLPAEDITIFVKHLASFQHREREIVQLTPDQKINWKEIFKGGSDTVQ